MTGAETAPGDPTDDRDPDSSRGHTVGDRLSRRSGLTVPAVAVLLVLALALGAGLVVADGVAVSCTAGDGQGAIVGQTDSNLTYEYNHTPEVSIWHPDAETVHFENETDGWIRASAADTAEVRIEEHGVDRTCLGPVNAGDHDVHVAPEHQHNVTIDGVVEALAFQPVDFDADDESELATNASSSFNLTIHDTGLDEDETIELTSVDDGGVDREADVDASGAVTFEIPAGEHELAVSIADDGNGAAPPPPPPPDDDDPATFEVTDRLVEPAEIEAGGTITASATVTNVGDETGTYTLELVVDGEVVASEDVTLAGGESETVSIEHVLDAPGEVEVSMAGESVETVSVQETDPPTDDDGETDDDGIDDDDADEDDAVDDSDDHADEEDDDGTDDTDTDDDAEGDDGDDEDDGLPWLWIALGVLALGVLAGGAALATGVLGASAVGGSSEPAGDVAIGSAEEPESASDDSGDSVASSNEPTDEDVTDGGGDETTADPDGDESTTGSDGQESSDVTDGSDEADAGTSDSGDAGDPADPSGSDETAGEGSSTDEVSTGDSSNPESNGDDASADSDRTE